MQLITYNLFGVLETIIINQCFERAKKATVELLDYK